MSKRPQYIAFSLVLLLVLILLNLPGAAASQLKLALSTFFLPLLGLKSSAEYLGEKAADNVLPRKALLREVGRLREENSLLRFQTLQATQVWAENERLRETLAWPLRTRWNLRPARVVFRDPANWWRSLHIDLGKEDGVSPNLPVLTPDGLVGRVWQVGIGKSHILLLGDPNCRVAALVEGTRDSGILGPGPSTVMEPSLLDLNFLARQNEIRPGQKVFTSGQGSVFPTDILIGTIVDTKSIDYGMYTAARVKLAADMAHLEEVWVLFP